MDLLNLFIYVMFGLAVVSTILTIIVIKKHPEVLDEKNRRNKKTDALEKSYWSWPPL